MNKRLFLIKLTHTIIWYFYLVVFLYILYSGIFNNINIWTFIAIGLVLVEVIILLIFKWRCPLTVAGYKYSETKEIGFDIFLPKWLAKYNKTIFSALFAVEIVLISYRLISN